MKTNEYAVSIPLLPPIFARRHPHMPLKILPEKRLFRIIPAAS
jgi:hypothetical protein